MKILFLAPQPFYQERGTPIAVRLAVQVLTERRQDKVDLLTYHEGKTVNLPNVELRRIRVPSFIRNVGPGISWKKLVCDVFFTLTAFKMVWQKRHDQYDLVHAVEESVFIAWLIRLFFGVPYLYDMDSSLALQVTEKWFWLKPLRPLLEFMERLAVRSSMAVVPVCDALAVIATGHGSNDTYILRDVSLLDLEEQGGLSEINLRAEAGIAAGPPVILYIGNLEAYQGVELLVDSFVEAAKSDTQASLVIIGGNDQHVRTFRDRVAQLGLTQRIHIFGPRPVASLSAYLRQADILASPRVKGNNTPMKIYSYLHSGRVILATDLPTHTQVMDATVAELAAPTVADYSTAMLRLLREPERRMKLGDAAKKLAEERYTFTVFSRELKQIYDRVGVRLGTQPAEPVTGLGNHPTH